jgi:hypothetical protein
MKRRSPKALRQYGITSVWQPGTSRSTSANFSVEKDEFQASLSHANGRTRSAAASASVGEIEGDPQNDRDKEEI